MIANDPLNGEASVSASFDTTFILFFLGLDLGQSVLSPGLDGLFSGVTLVLFAVLPYFVFDRFERPGFTGWLAGRLGIAGLAVGLGAIFGSCVGKVFPETFRYLPLTMLIAASIVTFHLQILSWLKFRMAK